MTKVRSKISGFSIIELMIVIAIVSLLAAIAIPSYKTYIIRSRISDAISAAESLKAKAIDYHQFNGVMPSEGWTNAYSSPYVSNVGTYSVADPKTVYLHAQLSSAVYSGSAGLYILIKLQYNNGVYTSTCGTDSRSANQIPARYLPATCQAILTVQ